VEGGIVVLDLVLEQWAGWARVGMRRLLFVMAATAALGDVAKADVAVALRGWRLFCECCRGGE
jgi:hypothetical protein